MLSPSPLRPESMLGHVTNKCPSLERDFLNFHVFWTATGKVCLPFMWADGL